MTKTITIPAADYVQRADDEGRDYYPLRTIEAAARAGWSDDQHMIDVTGERDDEDRTIVFAWVDAGNIAYNTISPDANMEGLYPADDLPFTIKTAEPLVTGQWVRPVDVPDTHEPYRVVEVTDNGIAHVALRAPWTQWDGSIPPSDRLDWVVVDAPTHAYTVTAPVNMTTDDLAAVLGQGFTVTRA